MSEEPETFTRTVSVPLVDADGIPIRIGSVLLHLEDNKCRGVVVEIGRKGEYSKTPLFSVGDINVMTSHGSYRVSNQYSLWRHIPREAQTYWERYRAWNCIPYDHDEDREASRDEGLAIDGIVALLPVDPVNWEYGPWADRLDDALIFLVNHLTEMESLNPSTPEFPNS